MRSKKIQGILIRKLEQCRFFTNFTFDLNFLEQLQCDFCCGGIFSRFSIIFRVCVTFSGIFGIAWIFCIFGLNNLFAIFCIFQIQKKIAKKYVDIPYDSMEFFVYLVLILGALLSILILFLELRCLGVVYFLIFFQFFCLSVFVLVLVIFCLFVGFQV